MMKLPQITTPTYPITLPDSKQEIEIRQLLTGEYKSLMKAYVMGDKKTIASTLSNILPACITTSIEFDKLSFVDVEFLFLKLYSVGIDNTLKIKLTCQKVHDDEPCNTVFGVQVPIEEIEPTTLPDNKIQLTDEVGIVLKHPTWKEWFTKDHNDTDVLFSIVDKIWTADSVLIPGVDFTKEELEQWMDTMPADKVNQVIAFIENAPTISWKKEVACPKCQNTETIRITGLEDFLE